MTPSSFPKALLAGLLLIPVISYAQSTRSAEPPPNPEALLERAERVDGLHGEGLRPWHLRAHWQLIEGGTTSTDEGSFEEWWVSDHRFRIVWSGKSFRQTRYGTDAGLVFTGSSSPPGEVPVLIDDALQLPLPALSPANLAPSHIQQNGETLECASRGPDLALAPQSGRLASAYEACFSGNPPAVRLEQGIGIEGLFNSIETFDGRQVPRQAKLIREPGSEVDLTIDSLELLDHFNKADFAPPPDAAPLEVRVKVRPDVLERYRIPGGLPPSYPAAAKQQHIEGTVVVAVVVREDGTVASARAVHGPEALRDAAMAAVASWRFHPYMVNGKPVEAESEVAVPFRLGSR